MNFFAKLNLILIFFIFLKADNIIDFTVNLKIDQDGTLFVTENILIKFNGLKHGIYRDIPTKYYDKINNLYKVGFSVSEVLADNEKTDYQVEPFSNGYRITIGNPAKLVNGTINYQIKYQTTRQIGFFKEHDEIFWNAIGNGFPYTINQANVKITLPQEFKIQKISGDIGLIDQKKQDFIAKFSDNIAEFKTTQALKPQEAFSVVVAWPKGLIKPPSFYQKIKWFLQDNSSVIFLIISLLFLAVYYLIILFKFVVKPSQRSIIPLYNVDNLLPAELNYIVNKCLFSDPILAYSTVDMAVKGSLNIEKISDQSYKLKANNKAPQEKVYQEILDYLFDKNFNDGKTVEIGSYESFDHAAVHNAQVVLEDYLTNKYGTKIIKTKTSFIFFSVLLSIISLILLCLIATPFVAIIAFILFAFMNVWFGNKMRIYTQEGQIILEQILGFKMFLNFTEAERLKYLSVDTRSPQEYEKFLPYAMALGVEKNWNDQYACLFTKMARQGNEYVPVWYWYDGHRASTYDMSFTKRYSTHFSSLISASSNIPGSYSGFSSGVSGGGAGRGGGGGGGGSW